MKYNDQIGDIINLSAIGKFAPYVETIVIEVEDGRATKLKAVNPDDDLGKVGWFKEGDDWVTFDYDIVTRN